MNSETKAELKIVLSLMSEGQMLIVEGQGKIWKARERLDNLINFDCAEPSWEQLTEAHGAGPPVTPPPYSSLKRWRNWK